MNESGRGNQEIYNEKEERQEQGRGIKRRQKTEVKIIKRKRGSRDGRFRGGERANKNYQH